MVEGAVKATVSEIIRVESVVEVSLLPVVK